MRLLPITRAVMLTIYFETVNDDSDGIALDYRCIPALIFKHLLIVYLANAFIQGDLERLGCVNSALVA